MSWLLIGAGFFLAVPEPPAFLTNGRIAGKAGNSLPSRFLLKEDLFTISSHVRTLIPIALAEEKNLVQQHVPQLGLT
jgi:hypothetical protein